VTLHIIATSNIHLERIVTSLAKILVFVARCGSGLFPILNAFYFKSSWLLCV